MQHHDRTDHHPDRLLEPHPEHNTDMQQDHHESHRQSAGIAPDDTCREDVRPVDRRPGDVCEQTGLIAGADGVFRPAWAEDADLAAYYDTEWGISPSGPGAAALDGVSEQQLFERLSLEAFQAGLSWATVLRKRPALREAFHHFDVDAVAAMGEEDIARLMNNPAIIRNRRKIEAVVSNAQATVVLRNSTDPADSGGLVALVRHHCPAAAPPPRHVNDIVSSSPESKALAAALKKRGFRFVGPTTIHALFQALGVVDDRVPLA